mmetsp:Transcript_7285/g.16660  ORF Transcript_7285/g.16660 Transcript_7285/m.16660 type:complete len:429 (+) Transcript_7285:1365-2651(+)
MLLLVVLGKLRTYCRSNLPLLSHNVRLLAAQLGQHGVLQHTPPEEGFDRTRHRVCSLVHLRLKEQEFCVCHEDLDLLVVLGAGQRLLDGSVGVGEALELHVELRQLHAQCRLVRLLLHSLDVVADCRLEVVRAHKCLPNLACQLGVLAVQLHGLLVLYDCLLRLLHAHVRLAEQAVTLHGRVALQQLHVALDVELRVAAVLEVNVCDGNFGGHVELRRLRHRLEHAQRSLNVSSSERNLTVDESDAGRLASARELLLRISDELGRFSVVLELAVQRGELEVYRGAVVHCRGVLRLGRRARRLVPHRRQLHRRLQGPDGLLLVAGLVEDLGLDEVVPRRLAHLEVVREGLLQRLRRRPELASLEEDLSHEDVGLRERGVHGDAPCQRALGTFKVARDELSAGQQQLALHDTGGQPPCCFHDLDCRAKQR